MLCQTRDALTSASCDIGWIASPSVSPPLPFLSAASHCHWTPRPPSTKHPKLFSLWSVWLSVTYPFGAIGDLPWLPVSCLARCAMHTTSARRAVRTDTESFFRIERRMQVRLSSGARNSTCQIRNWSATLSFPSATRTRVTMCGELHSTTGANAADPSGAALPKSGETRSTTGVDAAITRRQLVLLRLREDRGVFSRRKPHNRMTSRSPQAYLDPPAVARGWPNGSLPQQRVLCVLNR